MSQILILFFALPTVLKADLTISFEKDTVYACKEMSIVLQPEVNGGSQPYEYKWSNGTTANSIEVTRCSSLVYWGWEGPTFTGWRL